MARQQYTNIAISKLGASYTAGDSTVTLNTGDGALFPASGNFTIGVNDPPTFFLLCTARSGDVLTVNTSATEGTTAANGTVVAQVVTAAVLDGIRSDMTVIGSYSSLPSSGMKAGDTYYTLDSPYTFVYTGSAWQAFAYGYPVTVPPSTGWSFDQTISATENDYTYGSIWLGSPSTGSYKLNCLYRNATLSTPYRAKMMFQHDMTGQYPGVNSGVGNGQECGCLVGFRDTSSNIVTFGVINGGGTPGMFAHVWANASNGISNLRVFGPNTIVEENFSRNPIWLAVRDDGTNIYMEWSIDTFHWRTFYSESRTAHLVSTPQPCFASYNYYTPTLINLVSYSEVVP